MNDKQFKRLFGKRIKEERVKNNLSQIDLAEKANISDKYLSCIETGRQYPSVNILLNVSKSLNTEIKEFFDFSCLEKNKSELQKNLKDIIKEADEDKLKILLMSKNQSALNSFSISL